MPCKNENRYVEDGNFVLDSENKKVYKKVNKPEVGGLVKVNKLTSFDAGLTENYFYEVEGIDEGASVVQSTDDDDEPVLITEENKPEFYSLTFEVGDKIELTSEKEKTRHGRAGVENGSKGYINYIKEDIVGIVIGVDWTELKGYLYKYVPWSAAPNEITKVSEKETDEISTEDAGLDYEKLAEEVAKVLQKTGVSIEELEDEEEEVDKPEIGDVVKIDTKGENNYHNFNEGDICRVEKEGVNYLLRRIKDDKTQSIKEYDFHKVDSSESKWVELGREPGEFKEGDVVQVLKDHSGGVDLYKNEMGEVNLIGEDEVKVNGRLDMVNWAYKEDVKLICPVENRVDA